MSRVHVQLGALKKCKAWEYALRFSFGGVISVACALVSHVYGPVIGGFFLSFPAILPATLTLVKRHDGRAMAADDAYGACIGTAGLVAFAACTLVCARMLPPVIVLLIAVSCWGTASVATWKLVARRA